MHCRTNFVTGWFLGIVQLTFLVGVCVLFCILRLILMHIKIPELEKYLNPVCKEREPHLPTKARDVYLLTRDWELITVVVVAVLPHKFLIVIRATTAYPTKWIASKIRGIPCIVSVSSVWLICLVSSYDVAVSWANLLDLIAGLVAIKWFIARRTIKKV